MILVLQETTVEGQRERGRKSWKTDIKQVNTHKNMDLAFVVNAGKERNKVIRERERDRRMGYVFYPGQSKTF